MRYYLYISGNQTFGLYAFRLFKDDFGDLLQLFYLFMSQLVTRPQKNMVKSRSTLPSSTSSLFRTKMFYHRHLENVRPSLSCLYVSQSLPNRFCRRRTSCHIVTIRQSYGVFETAVPSIISSS
jgi:hypothetical protein